MPRDDDKGAEHPKLWDFKAGGRAGQGRAKGGEM